MIINFKKLLIVTLITFGVLNAYSQASPPDAAITSNDFVENLGSGTWAIMNIPKGGVGSRTEYHPDLPYLLKKNGSNGIRLHINLSQGDIYDHSLSNPTLHPDALIEIHKIVDGFLAQGMYVLFQVDVVNSPLFTVQGAGQLVEQQFEAVWTHLCTEMKNKSHRLAMAPFIEFHGWSNLARPDAYIEYNRLLQSARDILRVDNPTRIMGVKAYKAARIYNTEWTNLNLPFGETSKDYTVLLGSGASLPASSTIFPGWEDFSEASPIATRQQMIDGVLTYFDEAKAYSDNNNYNIIIDHWDAEWEQHGDNDAIGILDRTAYARCFSNTMLKNGMGGYGNAVVFDNIWDENTGEIKPVYGSSKYLWQQALKGLHGLTEYDIDISGTANADYYEVVSNDVMTDYLSEIIVNTAGSNEDDVILTTDTYIPIAGSNEFKVSCFARSEITDVASFKFQLKINSPSGISYLSSSSKNLTTSLTLHQHTFAVPTNATSISLQILAGNDAGTSQYGLFTAESLTSGVTDGILVVPNCYSEQEGILKNSTFECGAEINWMINTQNSAIATIANASLGNVYSENIAGRIDITSLPTNAYDNVLYTNAISSGNLNNKTVTVSCYAKSSNANNFKLRLKLIEGNSVSYLESNELSLSNSYNLHTATFNVATNTDYVAIEAMVGNQLGTYYFDEFTSNVTETGLENCTANQDVFVVNPDFECRSNFIEEDYWRISNSGTGVGDYSYTTDAYSGTNATITTVTTSGSAPNVRLTSTPVEGDFLNKRLELSFYAKSPTATSIRARITTTKTVGGVERTIVPFVLTTNYTQYSLFHDVTESSTEVSIALEMGNEIGDYYVDNIIGEITSIILPVELLLLDATVSENKSVILDWRTATEINNDYFNIEKSIDGYEWKTIGKTKGAGNSSQINNYQFIDKNPTNGLNYYRLRQVDFNGDFEYTSIVTAFLKTTNSTLRAFPNPTTGVFTIEGMATPNTLLELEVVDVLGQTIWEGNTMSDSNGSILQTIGIGRFAAGMYYLKWNDGVNVKTLPIVKAK
ncbi:MAG: T9SS type A sorting domain-containing protein [Saprospiraceae bacterium]